MELTAKAAFHAGLLVMMGVAASAQTAPVAGEVAEGSLTGKTLTFVSYGGIYQDGQIASLQDFVTKSGVTLLSDGPTEVAKIQAQVESGDVQWDVVDTGTLTPYVYCGALFQKLDFSKIDISNIPEGQVGECSVPAMNYGTVLMYKKSAYGDNPPKGWADFFDTETFPGTRAMPGDSEPDTTLIELALLADGVAKDQLFPADVDRALNKFRGLGDDLIFWRTGAESQQMMESGEADMVIAWSGRAMGAQKNGAEYEPVWQDWIVVKDQLTIPVGVKDADAAYALINAAIGKRAQEIMTEQTSYSPIHKDSQPQVDDLVKSWLTNTPEKIARGYQQNIEYWVANYDEVETKWGEFIAGN
ncbi:extracellular solute-binding protein [Albidovulum sp.]|uniref:extracellular solute-binding protein n=1 Tax=Albidovulum sp. TaxID=1872424 RepID=UPI0039B94418